MADGDGAIGSPTSPRSPHMDELTGRNPAYYMEHAYREAVAAFDEGEVPVGAVVVGPSGAIIGRGRNSIERLADATAHAEILAIGAAAQCQGTWRLNDCSLYVTLEPCLMCLGAILASRVGQVTYAATDPRLGAVDSHPVRESISQTYRTFPATASGIMSRECSELLSSFFRKLRNGREGD